MRVAADHIVVHPARPQGHRAENCDRACPHRAASWPGEQSNPWRSTLHEMRYRGSTAGLPQCPAKQIIAACIDQVILSLALVRLVGTFPIDQSFIGLDRLPA